MIGSFTYENATKQYFGEDSINCLSMETEK